MARNSNVSKEVAEQLSEAVLKAREAVYGPGGIPPWGTKFADIERAAIAAGNEFARQFMERAVSEQAEKVPADALDTGGEVASLVTPTPLKVETGCGDVEWNQPASYLNESRRSFFPSGEGAGH